MNGILRFKIRIGNKGFTLAELLVALTVIGITAALTIPVVAQRIQEAQFRQAWRKTFSSLSLVTNKIMYENGGTLIGVFNSGEDIMDKYAEKVQFTEKCMSQDSWCWPPKIYELTGGESGYTLGAFSFKLINGTLVKFHQDSSTCFNGAGRCGWIIVDINGFKGPSTLGKDVYAIEIHKNRIVPFGVANNDPSDCNTTGGAGYTCGRDYLMQ